MCQGVGEAMRIKDESLDQRLTWSISNFGEHETFHSWKDCKGFTWTMYTDLLLLRNKWTFHSCQISQHIIANNISLALLTIFLLFFAFHIVVLLILISLIKEFLIQNIDPGFQDHYIIVDAVRKRKRKNKIKDTIHRICKILL